MIQNLVGKTVVVKVKGLKNSIVGKLVYVNASKSRKFGNVVVETNLGKTIVKGSEVQTIATAPIPMCDLYEISNPHGQFICSLEGDVCPTDLNPSKCGRAVIVDVIVV